MEIRFCGKCQQEKIEKEFFEKKTEGRLTSWCRACLYEYQHARWKDRKKKAVALLGGKCSKCGYDKCLGAIEFHHLDPSKKEFDFHRVSKMSWDKILKEIEKCVLLCSNRRKEEHSTPDMFNWYPRPGSNRDSTL